ncbi:MAG: hypothetical protein ACLTKT_03500 [Clostridia bacterium]
MKNNIELLKKLIEKIKETPESIIEEAIDSLSEKIVIEDILCNLSIDYVEEECKNFNIESENKEWKESLQLAA